MPRGTFIIKHTFNTYPFNSLSSRSLGVSDLSEWQILTISYLGSSNADDIFLTYHFSVVSRALCGSMQRVWLPYRLICQQKAKVHIILATSLYIPCVIYPFHVFI